MRSWQRLAAISRAYCLADDFWEVQVLHTFPSSLELDGGIYEQNGHYVDYIVHLFVFSSEDCQQQ